MKRSTAFQKSAGFTLIEVLVASAILALMALISWRGLDGMA
ncbi:MAG: prepilin-type N-terminal cleavage/methylation domain-containing protein, partial [Betaproteobacteria bacterium]|nr:prepilin-type N-terminal cleavage/methylation domain-containing protein [Betaproteobacteria bacterium]